MPASTVAGCGKQKPANVSSEQDSNSKSSREQGESMTTWGEHIKTWFKGSWRSVIFIGKPSWVWGPSAPASGLWVHTPGSRQLGSQWCTLWGNGQDIAEDFSLVSWVMRTVSEWWVQAAGREFHHETVQFREWELSNFNVGQVFMILWELGAIRHINQILKLRQCETLMPWDQSSWGDTR